MADKNTYWIHPDEAHTILSALRISEKKLRSEGNDVVADQMVDAYRNFRQKVDGKYPGWITSSPEL